MRACPCKGVTALKLFSGYEKGYVIRHLNPIHIKFSERERFFAPARKDSNSSERERYQIDLSL
jgi:hypothetical protein